ncbi:GDSL-type esterase/lipase family protein [Achromobacter denitrificans]|uniref:SGNH hydrolase-type esterase domain-containing protein n=1 Tax=Achromobacter denitrificans TaxID=32002 RepID=A0A6N0JJJ0_ACHDE|nr:GDSL-type esterase/lipase family protein [Achromobacter denitrificans]QKQ46836.1 hypothetical protein FOC81_09090 [Achromobacter denitrificans]
MVTSTTTRAVDIGSLEIPVIDATVFKADQLICFVGTDNQYYSGVIKSAGSTSILLKTASPAALAAGAPVYNFYRNEAHASEYGNYAIIDGSIRQLTHAEMHVVTQSPASWVGSSSGVVTQDQTFTYNNPGALITGRFGALVTCPGLSAGAASSPVALRAGVYNVQVPINVGQRVGGYAGAVIVDVVETTAAGQTAVIGTQTTLGNDGIRLIKCMFSTQPGSTVHLQARNANSGGAHFSLGQIRYCRVTDKIKNLDSGRHVLFGDSWVANGWVTDRMSAALPNAEIIRKGIPGDFIRGLVARFWTDVAPLKPDFVWVMCGTNDYYSYTAAQFSAELGTIKRNIMQIGAQAIFWNASVGSAYYPAPPFERLTNSRAYAMDITYHDQAI